MGPSHMPGQPEQLSRRQVLKTFGAAASLAAAAFVEDRLHPAETVMTAIEDHGPHSNVLSAAEREVSRGKAADLASAAVVTGEFLRSAAWNGVVRPAVSGEEAQPMGPKSATLVGGLEGARIALLSAFGGKQTARASRELRQMEAHFGILPLFVGLSDLTRQALKIDPDVLLSREAFPLKIPDRPVLQADNIDAWREHHRELQDLLVSVATDMVATTSVLAPLGTTFASSDVSEHMKDRVIRVLYEFNFAKAVLDEIQAGAREPFATERLEQQAVDASNEQFNGRWGFTKLAFTTASNVHGSYGIGGPPEILAAMRHVDHPRRLLRSHAFGLVNSEGTSMEVLSMWLHHVGISLDGQEIHRLVQQQGMVTMWLTKLFTKARGPSEEQPGIQIDIPHYLDIKREAARSAWQEASSKTEDEKRAVLGLFEKTMYNPTLFLNSLFQGTTQIDKVIRDVVDRDNDRPTFFETLPEEIQGRVVEDPAVRDTLIDTRLLFMMKQVERQARDRAQQGASAAAAEITAGGDVGEIARRVLEGVDEHLDRAHAVGEKIHDAVIDRIDFVRQEMQKEGVLSRRAHDQFWSMMTQIPALGAMEHLAQELVPRLFGYKDGQRLERKEIKAAIATYLLIVTSLAAVSDTAGAYLFGEECLEEFFKTIYGDDVFVREPLLADLAMMVPLKLAEQAGALTRAGNVSNFSQTSYQLRIEHEKIVMESKPLSTSETLNNGYAHVANAQLFMLGYAAFAKIIDRLEPLAPDADRVETKDLSMHSVPSATRLSTRRPHGTDSSSSL